MDADLGEYFWCGSCGQRKRLSALGQSNTSRLKCKFCQEQSTKRRVGSNKPSSSSNRNTERIRTNVDLYIKRLNLK